MKNMAEQSTTSAGKPTTSAEELTTSAEELTMSAEQSPTTAEQSLVEIPLRRYYPHVAKGIKVAVAPEVLEVLSMGGRWGTDFKRRKREHEECSHDANPSFEADAYYPVPTLDEVMERKEEYLALYNALDKLQLKQRRRVYAHYILGMSKVDIARSEGVDESAIRSSIVCGINALRKILKKNF